MRGCKRVGTIVASLVKRISLSPLEVKLQLNDLDDKCPEQVLVLIDKDQLSQKPAAVTSPSR